MYYKEGTLPVAKNNKNPVIFVINKGDGISAIAKNLSNQGLIRNKIIFYLVVRAMGFEKQIQAGDFRLNPSMNIFEISSNLTHGTLDIWMTIIEGKRREEIAQIISQDFDIPESEFLKLASQEGRLFPDTYLVPKDASAVTIVNILTNNFQKRYEEVLTSDGNKNKLSEDEIMILASLVEKEAKTDIDRQKVASIILKRYQEDWPLQIDATVQYALGYQDSEKTWWKKSLTKEDTEIDSPYNTYKNTGLPPGPICNPGLASIEGVLNADPKTPYWYYLSDINGGMHYAVTLEEHNANIAKYL